MSIEYEFGINFDTLRADVAAAKPIALTRGAEHVRSVAVPKTPIESGNLRGSYDVTVFDDEAHIKVPGPYARRQHYELDWKHPRGGQALYLEEPMVTESEAVLRIFNDTIREAM